VGLNSLHFPSVLRSVRHLGCRHSLQPRVWAEAPLLNLPMQQLAWVERPAALP
jgi:hypothetical protein